MRAFAIIETNVTAYPTVAEAKQAVAAAGDSEPRLAVTSQAELAASSLAVGQLVDMWNGFAGVVPFDDLKPVKKFTDRKTAVARIWKAIQRLAPAPTVAPAAVQAAQDTPEAAAASEEASPKKRAARVRQGANEAAPAREGSKKAQVIALLKRPHGATLSQIREVTGWQAHSVRGFISGTLGKKLGLQVESTKRETGERAYRLA